MTTNHTTETATNIMLAAARTAVRGGQYRTMAQQLAMSPRMAVIWQAAMLLEGKRPFLSSGNPKLQKAQGWRNVGLTLSPADEFNRVMGYGKTNCILAAGGCDKVCVGAETGQGRLASSKIARCGRTLAIKAFADDAFALIVSELDRHSRNRDGLPVAVRTNVASDLPNYARRLKKARPALAFYDYTAIPGAVRRADGVHRILSHKGPSNIAAVRDTIKRGHGVAVVFDISKTDAKPETWEGAPVIDGDLDDVWFARKPETGPFVVGLYLKGTKAQKAQARSTGFAVAV